MALTTLSGNNFVLGLILPVSETESSVHICPQISTLPLNNHLRGHDIRF